eukprot:3229552-Rhodomonas_salina.5
MLRGTPISVAGCCASRGASIAENFWGKSNTVTPPLHTTAPEAAEQPLSVPGSAERAARDDTRRRSLITEELQDRVQHRVNAWTRRMSAPNIAWGL